MAIADEFKSRIGIVDLTLTKFVDRHGVWAKRSEDCVNVEYTFADGNSGTMTYDEYRTLPYDQRTLIQEAPSS